MRWPRLGRRPKDGTGKPNAYDLFVAADGDAQRYAELLADAGLTDQPVRDPKARDLRQESP